MKKNVLLIVSGIVCFSLMVFAIKNNFSFSMGEVDTNATISNQIDESLASNDSLTDNIDIEDNQNIEDNIDDNNDDIKEEEKESKITYVADESLKYNEIGEVIVIMYHGLTKEEVPDDPYHRSVAGFKADLQRLYDLNYRLITLDEYISGDFDIPKGTTPVLLTFDDGLDTAFSLSVENEKYIEKADTAIDIIEEFYLEHEDFGRHATFFVYNQNLTFGAVGSLAQRNNYLIDKGYSIGNHSYRHNVLSKLDNKLLNEEVGLNHYIVYNESNNYDMKAFAYPYGLTPSDEDIFDTFNNEYNGLKYSYDVAFLASPVEEYSANPYAVNFDRYKIPRFRGTDNDYFDIGYLLRHYETNPERRYISDGDSSTLTVPESMFDKVNTEAVKEKGMDIIVITS